MIKNKYLRIVCIPLALLSWSIQFCVFGIIACFGSFFVFMGLFACLIFGDEMDWKLLFACFIGWWAYYPWLWWYRYFTTGQLTMLEEFKEH